MPFISGFRYPLDTASDEEKTKAPNRIHWSTVYKEIVQGILRIGSEATTAGTEPFFIKILSQSGALVEVDARELGIVISVDEVETATIFNQRVYAYLNRDRYPFILDKMTNTLKSKQEPADAAVAKVARVPGD